ncbi:tetratricopeptide repeat protein [Umezawaea sp.]|uniref:tetratricopeptide repeat protein n=1 Tax=Umezawaea sp. TaxID=1955258 RepID=UPI002ED0662F
MSPREGSPSSSAVSNSISGDVQGNVVNAGTILGGVRYELANDQAEVTLPHRAGAVPPRAMSFQRRSATSSRLGGADTTVLVGLGGVGKTQLAVDFAERLWESGELDLLVWVTASSRESVVAEYAHLASALFGDDRSDPERGARRLLTWLATTSCRWLVVLDDIRTPSDVNGLWPPGAGGRVVATTRRRDTAVRGVGRDLVDVGVFAPEESYAYLRTAFSDSRHLLASFVELADDLGHLPLALAQASAYALDRQLSCEAYRARFADRRRRLASLFPEVGSLPDEHRTTVATTWSLSVELADQLTPAGLGRPLLAVASLLDPNGIPAEVFTTTAVLDLLVRATGRSVDVDDSTDGLHCLHRLSLITFDSTSVHTVRVHSLVQRATRDDLQPGALKGLTHVAARALNAVWPSVERDQGFVEVLRVNADALEVNTDGVVWDCHCRNLLFRAAISRGESGAVAAARDQFTRFVNVARARLGEEHPYTLHARDHCARWTGEAGGPREALAQFEALISDCRRVLGADHPDTLEVYNNLAYWRAHSGDVEHALREFRDLVQIYTQVLGPEHPSTLTARSNVARWTGEAGDPAAAVSCFEVLLPDLRRVLGDDNVLTMTTSHNLAHWRGGNGDVEGAVAGLERVLSSRSKVLGDDHPHTLSTRNNLAYWRAIAGDTARAVTEFRAVLADRKRVLGNEHPETLATLRECAYWWDRAGLFADAAAAYKDLLIGARQTWNVDDHSVLTLHRNIITCLRDAGDTSGMVEGLKAMAVEFERVYGPGEAEAAGFAEHIAALSGAGTTAE